MSNTNKHLENRFMQRYEKVKSAEKLLLDSINMLNTINLGTDHTEVVNTFLSTLSEFDVNTENLNEVKQILQEFLTNEMSQNETLAYFNYLYDVACFKAEQLWLIQDIFKCYF